MTETEIIEAVEKIAANVDLLIQNPDIVPMRLRIALIQIYETGRKDGSDGSERER